MDKKALEAKLAEVTKEFDDLETQKQEIIQRQFELRGKYQTYQEQIDELKPKKGDAKVAEENKDGE